MARCLFSFCVAVLSLLPMTFAAEVAFPLVSNGRPTASVVVAGDHPAIKAAVEDLKTYVRRISGAELNVSEGMEDLPGPTLHIGETDLYGNVAGVIDKVRLDGYGLVKIGEDLLLAGKMQQGTANGIIAVLQDQFDVRWYYAGPLWEVVPTNKSLTVRFTPTHEKEVYLESPTLYGRTLWGRAGGDAFGRRMRLTGKDVTLPYVGAGHSLGHVVPASEYAQSHPEYFALMGGKRILDGSAHACFTHPDMLEIFMKYIRKGSTSFGVIDNLTACQCDRCMKIDGKAAKYLGMWNFSETFCQLMKRVAEQTAKEFPGKRLGIFAYQQTSSPPQTVDRIGDNVDVVLCQDTAQHFDPELQKLDHSFSEQWARKVGGVRFYGYVGINYWTPRYFPTILARQIKHLTDIGLKGWGTHSVTMTDTSMPLFYMMYQMLWNADLDHKQLIDEMITDLYGEAAEPMRQFYDHWEQCWMRQKKARWFWGMDNFRGEMEIYTWGDIARDRQLLNKAASLATEGTVKQRIQWISERYRWTELSARAHCLSMQAIQDGSPEDSQAAIAKSHSVVKAWKEFADYLPKAQKLGGITPNGWLDKTFRVRAWGLKQQMRDAVAAPLVRWIVVNEQKLAPDKLRDMEEEFAQVAIANRRGIEKHMTKQIDGHERRPHANGLRVPTIPKRTPAIGATADDWPEVPTIDAIGWVFRTRPPDQKIGKYEEPMPQNIVDPPDSKDQSMTWQAAWDNEKLYLRIAVADDLHVQKQPAAAMWKEDGVQIAFDPDRSNFDIPGASWDFLWGGYQGCEVEFGVSLVGDKTNVFVWHRPESLQPSAAGAGSTGPREGAPPSAWLKQSEKTAGSELKRPAKPVDPLSLIEAKAARHDGRTVYEVAVDWRLIAGFNPLPRKSLGISLVVNDLDKGIRRSAEYGSGVIHAKRTTDFAAIRLGE